MENRISVDGRKASRRQMARAGMSSTSASKRS